MNKKLNPWAAIGVALLYFLFVFASCFIGFLHPACWAYFSVLAAILAVGPYFWLAARWQRFGVGTVLALLVCLFCLATGEAGGLLSKAIILGGGVLAAAGEDVSLLARGRRLEQFRSRKEITGLATLPSWPGCPSG